MTDHATVFPPGWRLTNTNGDPISGGTVEFYSPGTTTPLTVYSDKDLTTPIGTSLTTDSGGYPSSGGNKCIVYTSTDALKLILRDDAGVSLATHDQWQAFSVTTGAGSGSALQHVLSKSADFTVQSTQSGYVFNCDPTGASFQATLLSAITAADGFNITIRHDGTANQVKIAPSLSQTIKLPGGSTTSGFSLTGKGHSVTLVSDGAGWVVTRMTPPLIASNVSVFNVVSRITSAPASPTPGARYLINGSPSGTLATLGFADKDVAEADGQGGWIKYTPSAYCGWLAYNQADGYIYQFGASTWTALSNVSAPSASTLRRMVVRDQRASGTSPSTMASGSWTTRTLQTVVENTITTTYGASSDASLASNIITLPTGTYLVIAKATAQPNVVGTGTSRNRLRNITTGSIVYSEPESTANSAANASNTSAECPIITTVTVSAASETFDLQSYAATSGVNLGVTMSLSSISEVFASVEILDLSSIQGPQGVAGPQGSAGPGYSATSITSNTIGTGSKTWTTQTGLAYTAGARVRCADSANPATNYNEGVVTSYSASSLVVTVDRTAGIGTITSWNINLAGDVGAAGATGSAGSTGATGATGATGPNTGLDYAWSTSTSGDPGSGKVLGNNATLASITQINISKTGRNSESLSAVIATWDDSTNTAHYGHLRIFKVSDRTAYLELEITSTLTDNGTYWSIPVSRTASGGTLSANDILAVMFERTGNKGTDGAGSGDVVGPAASVDSEIALFSGTTGKLLKRASLTGLVKAASGVVSAATAGTDYLAPPSGTAILKANSGGALANATAGTDYLAPPSGTAILKANSGGALANATAGTDYMHPGTTSNMTVGVTATAYNIGTPTNGSTVTLAGANGQLQYLTNNVAGFTIAAPAADTAITLIVTNGATAGTITFSGFTVGSSTGSSLTTTNASKFRINVCRINGVSSYDIYALQ